MNKKTILTKFGQEHNYEELVTIFKTLSEEDKSELLETLGLSEFIGDGGELAPVYSVDIISSVDRFLDPTLSEHKITLEGRLYNFFSDISLRATNWKWTRISGDISDKDWVRTTQNIEITEVDLTEKIRSGKVIFKLEATINDKVYNDTIDFSTSLYLSNIQIKADNYLFLGEEPENINLSLDIKGINPKTYTWFVDNVLKGAGRTFKLENYKVQNGSIANIKVEVKDESNNIFTDSISIPKIVTGQNGEQGVPGPPGENGVSLYTWIRYADDETGQNMSEYPSNLDGSFKKYIGIATNKTSPTESENPADYIWSSYVGDQGIPGANGYMWVIYSQFPDGINTSNKVEINNEPYDLSKDEWMNYLGLAYNKQEQQEPNFNAMTPTVFKEQGFYWSKIKGEDGHTGYVLDLSNEVHTIPTNAAGQTVSNTAYEGAETELSLFYGNDIVPLTEYTIEIESSTGLTFNRTQTTNVTKAVVTNVNNMGDNGTIKFKAYDKKTPKNLLSSATFTITKVKSKPSFKISPSVSAIRVQPGIGSAQDTITPSNIIVQVLKNDGTTVSNTTLGTLTYKYSYQTGDGTPLPINTSFAVSNAGNPNFLQFMYFDTDGMLADIESIPFVRDGKPGENGKPGTDGKDGVDGAPGTAGPLVLSHEWKQGVTYYNNSIRKDYVYLRGSNKWYKLKSTISSKVAGVGPDSNWEEAPEMQSMIIAEKMNIGGWIISNNKLFSQAGLIVDAFGTPLSSNIILNGLTGEIIFGNNLMKLTSQGITMNDDLDRMRIIFGKDETGTPVLRFLAEDGSIQWEAGKDNFKVITQGTQPLVWETTSFSKIHNIPNIENPDNIPNFDSIIKNNLSSSYNYVGSQFNDGRDMPQDVNGYGPFNTYKWKDNAFSLTNYGHLIVNKGDMLINENVYMEGYYKDKIAVNNNEIPSDKLIDDGWYYTIRNGLSMYMEERTDISSTFESFKFYTYVVYYKNGKVVGSKRVYITEAPAKDWNAPGGGGEVPLG